MRLVRKYASLRPINMHRYPHGEHAEQECREEVCKLCEKLALAAKPRDAEYDRHYDDNCYDVHFDAIFLHYFLCAVSSAFACRRTSGKS